METERITAEKTTTQVRKQEQGNRETHQLKKTREEGKRRQRERTLRAQATKIETKNATPEIRNPRRLQRNVIWIRVPEKLCWEKSTSFLIICFSNAFSVFVFSALLCLSVLSFCFVFFCVGLLCCLVAAVGRWLSLVRARSHLAEVCRDAIFPPSPLTKKTLLKWIQEC